jgi:hypothetical protein
LSPVTRRLRLVVACLAWALACGGDADQPTGGVETSAAAAAENRAPVIESVRLAPTEPQVGEVVRATVRASDPDGDRPELSYVWRVDGVLLDEEGPALTLTGVERSAPIEVTVTARDAYSASDPARAQARVRNQRPRLLEVRAEPWDVVPRGTPVVVSARGSDPDGDSLEYRIRWQVNGETLDVDEFSLPTADLQVGDAIQARVVASDGEGESDPIDSARVRVANAHPRILSAPSGLSEDGSFHYRVEATDPDSGAALRFLLRAAPRGMRIDPGSGEIVWQPGAAQTGHHDVEVEVKDSEGAVTIQHFELEVAAADSPS